MHTCRAGEYANGTTSSAKKGERRKKKSTARGIPRRSPIQVLTSPDVAWLRWSDENRYFQRGMAVDEGISTVMGFIQLLVGLRSKILQYRLVIIRWSMINQWIFCANNCLCLILSTNQAFREPCSGVRSWRWPSSTLFLACFTALLDWWRSILRFLLKSTMKWYETYLFIFVFVIHCVEMIRRHRQQLVQLKRFLMTSIKNQSPHAL